jgi:hypothetical protein
MQTLQHDAELAEALRVHFMTAAQRTDWLENVWGRVQRNAQAFLAHAPEYEPTARSYVSLEEKNRFDEARELRFAMQYSVFAVQNSTRTP